MSKLIILDLYGTLVMADAVNNIVRPGLQDFLEHYRREHCSFAVSSDGTHDGVRDTLKITGLISKIDGIYDARHLEEYAGQYLKNLSAICDDFGIHPQNSVFIGDDFQEIDSCSAHLAQIRFIQVAQFRKDKPSPASIQINGKSVIYENLQVPFSFNQLIGKI